MPRSARSEKLHLHLSPEAKRRIVAAAESQQRSVTDFVLQSDLDRANETLADQRVWTLNAEQWKKFQEALDAPPRDLPELRKLLREESVFERPQEDGAKAAD